MAWPWLSLAIAPIKLFRESEAIGSLAWRGLGLALALPQSSYFEKVRLLEAWHGVASACLGLDMPCVGFGLPCLGLALALPCFALRWHVVPWPWHWHCPNQAISRK